MNKPTKPPESLSVRELLCGKDNYLIPMYQRNYAWDEGEITQLIQDVIDYQPKAQDYYIGSLVVFDGRVADQYPVYEVIDGQQRLTTLALLATYIRHTEADTASWYQRLNIDFECRENSRQTLSAIFSKKWEGDTPNLFHLRDINAAVLHGYEIIKKVLPQKLKESSGKLTLTDFSNFLFDRVQILRIGVPDDTDLNHYFEVMNNRGEQLERHEVLKSRLLEVLNDIADQDERESSQYTLHRVWEACANMEKYVQAGFTPNERDSLFGDTGWNHLEADSFESLRGMLHLPNSTNQNAQTLTEIISSQPQDLSLPEMDEGSQERFHAVINFPNFLLQVLRVSSGEDIPLDDKAMLDTFEHHIIRVPNAVEKVKEFTFSLLRCKQLFDQFIIKREFLSGTDNWSLKSYKKNSSGKKAYYANTFGVENTEEVSNQRALMLLAAFHVSTPTMVYKHWLNAALNWLYQNAYSIQASDYINHLESVANAFIFDRFLSEQGKDYYQIIYVNNGKCQSQANELKLQVIEQKLSYSNIENNLIFNYLDYLLWLDKKGENKKIQDFTFTFRSSVEHYYPQNPRGHSKWPPEHLNCFGNLCLISHSKNSRLSDFLPEAKKEHYADGSIDSIKQHLMMDGDWTIKAMQKHHDDMVKVLVSSLKKRD